ncbi:MAG: helix-turn-helix domain-containing protein [Pseudomonadota bacterium]
MPNIASILKAEIARVARKEVKAETQALKASSTKFRSDIAALKREVAALQAQIKRASAVSGNAERPGVNSDLVSGHRFSAKGLASHRARLRLSAEAVGKLVGASALSIYKWESGKARPRAKYLPAIAALRTLGLKQAAAVLESR